MSTNWWKKTTQLRDIKDPTILQHQIAKQQFIRILSTCIKNSILPDVIAQIVLNFIFTKQLYKHAHNDNLQFKLRTVSLSPLLKISNTNLTNTISWKANYKKCIGMEFKLKKGILICGIELDLCFGGVQCYAVLSQYTKTKNKSPHHNKTVYKNTWSYKLIPCDVRQKINIKTNRCGYIRKSQMIFTEINKYNNGGLKLKAKNTMYKLGFVISDGFYCNNYINLRHLNTNNFGIHKNVKCVNWRLLNKSKLLGNQNTYFGEGLIEDDGTSNALKWFPKMRFLTF